MNILKKIIVIASSAIVFSSLIAYAEPINNENMHILFDEKTTCCDEYLNIDVFVPEKNINNYSDVSDIIYRKQIKSDNMGLLSVDFAVDENAVSGLYNVVISGNNYSLSKEIFILNFKQSKEAVEKMNIAVAQGDTDKIKSILSEYYHDLYAENPKYKIPDILDKASKLNYNYLKENNITLTNDNVSFIINKAVSISAIENGKLNNAVIEAERLGMNQGDLKDFYNKYYVTEATGKRIAERLNNKKYNSFEEFDKNLLEAFILSVLEKPDGSDNAKELLQKFSNEIGITANGTTYQYTAVCGKNFSNYNDLKKAFEAAKDNNNSGGGGSSGGSGNGVIGNVGTMTISSTQQNNNDIHTHPIVIFDDLEGYEWAEDAIVYLAEKLIVLGKEDKKFYPNDNITREEFVKMIVNAFSINTIDDRTFDFNDVDIDAWYYEYVKKAYCSEIVLGQDANKFGVGSNITREDMAVMLKRAADYAGITLKSVNSNYRFDDDGLISDYAKDSVYLLKENKIINGVDEYGFAPKANATRAQAAKLIYGLLMN